MWNLIVDKLLWSIVVVLISSIISYFISKRMMRKNLKSNLYVDEIKEIKGILKISLEDIKQKEPIFMDLREFGYMKKEDYWTRIESLSLNDAELKKLLSKYLQTIDKYNSEYFEYNKKHSAANALGEDTIDSEERDKLLSALKQSLQNLYQTINSRIEKIIT